MKSLGAYILVLMVAANAHGAMTETAPVRQKSQSTWQKVTIKVKQWYSSYFGPGDVVPAPTPAPAETVVQKAPSAAPAASTPPTSTVQVAPTPKPTPTPELNQLRQTPVYTERATGSTLSDVQSVRERVQSASVLKVAQPGRAGTSKLARTKQGVPVINWKQLKVTKKIPRLDIGTENLISRNDFTVDKLDWGLAKPSDLKRLPSPKPIADSELAPAFAIAAKIVPAASQRGLQANLRTVGQPVTREAVDKIQYSLTNVPEFKPLPYAPLSEESLKMVAALILFEKGNHCHMIMGLFNQLREAEKTKVEATYHLGACADQLGMHQSAFDKLAQVVKSEDKDFAAAALTLLAKDLPIIYERDFYEVVKSLKAPKALINDTNRDDVSYRVAKGAFRAGDYKTANVYADQVSDKYPYYDDARFLSGMNSFALGDKARALKKLEELSSLIDARKTPSNIRALVSVNLARMYFAQKKYDKALERYMQVPKDHALWVQALIEQGWTQLAINDHSGAIGNMYSLHSPYFKAVYQPESFVVRAIGYLNICQYGDAYKTISWLEKDYRDWYAKTDRYLQSSPTPEKMYETVKTYIRGKSTDSIEGVPYQIWREMARRKDFLNMQTAMNDKQDEERRYEGVNEKIKTEKASIRARAEQAKKRFDEWAAALRKAKTDKVVAMKADEFRRNLQREKENTVAYRFQLAILEQSRQGYLEFQKSSQSRLDKETTALSQRAGQTLLTRAKDMRTDMSRVLENNEFLRYEVFSGSGENIRYQVAGGEVGGTPNRIPAHIKPTKMMNWSFDGEFWEDEIGSYRSSLENACPAAAQSEAKPMGETAGLLKDN